MCVKNLCVKFIWGEQVWVNVGPETRLATVLDVRPRHGEEAIYKLDIMHGRGYWWGECELYESEEAARNGN
jgi:hypothetical protein